MANVAVAGANQNFTKPNYREFIAFRSQANPCIAGLNAYAARLVAIPNTPRLTLLDYLGDATVPEKSRPVTDTAELDRLLASPAPNLKGRVLLVENITADLVSALGSTLDVDPAFFAGHIATDFQDIEKAPPPPSLAFLPSRIAEKGFLHAHYQLVIDLGSADEFVGLPYAFKTESNVPRNVRRLPPLSGRQLALARGCCSILVTSFGRQWVCLILTDPPIATAVSRGGRKHPSRPLHRTFEDFANPIPFSRFGQAGNIGPVPEEAQSSMLHSLVGYLRCEQPPGFASSPPYGLVLAFGYYPIRIALAEWVMYTHLTSRYLKYYEYSLQEVHNRLHNSDLVDLQRWRRRCKQSQYKLLTLAEFVNYWLIENEEKGVYINDQAKQWRRCWELVLKDINQVDAQLRDYNHSLEQMIPVATSMVRLLDARHSLVEAANTTRLTYIALVFVPLSWVASLFSMTDKYQPGHEQFWVYPAMALPLVFALLLGSILINGGAKPAQVVRGTWLAVKGFWETVREYRVSRLYKVGSHPDPAKGREQSSSATRLHLGA
ncbi:hypothetical protein RB597_004760 [Gaeumannomyces tritici]